MMAIFSTTYYTTIEDALNAKWEIENVIEKKRHYYIIKLEVVPSENEFILYNKTFIVCPN